MAVLIGCSGWQYRQWRERFYPKGVPQRLWLEHYLTRFDTVEVNNAFYRLPEASTFDAWRDRTPDGFCIAVKANRYLTHISRLRDPVDIVGRMMERYLRLGPKLGPVLLQLPPTLRFDRALLDDTLAAFPRGVRVAVEPRHDSWWNDVARAALEAHDVALCLADRHGPITPLWRTASWGYLRLHEGSASPHPCYEPEQLTAWAARLAVLYEAGDDVFVYFNNDINVCAPRDAARFADACRAAGLVPTRVPREDEVTLIRE